MAHYMRTTTTKGTAALWARVSGAAMAAVVATVVVAASGSAAYSGASHGHYVVRAGDSVTALAARFGLSPATLASANHLADPDQIFVGQSLVIPSAGSSSVSVRAAAVAVAVPAPSGPLAPVYAPRAGSPHFPSQLLAHSSRLALRPAFRHWARVYGVPTGLLEALTWMESGWQENVVSSTGAVGIGQLEPSTVQFVSFQLFGLSKALNPRSSDANIRMSAAFLAYILRQAHGSVANALGGYYQGLSSVLSAGPYSSTRHYVLVIGELWAAFRSG
jgi:N-acetylmuramoyl-L-alanine amidase